MGRRIAEGNGMSAMTTEQKIIKAKIGLLELAKQLGNVSQACKVMGCYSPGIVFTGSRSFTTRVVIWRWPRSAGASRSLPTGWRLRSKAQLWSLPSINPLGVRFGSRTS